ncbi:MAG: beta-hydroxyacyl-ACP dehydratase [Rubripirellula sp.]|jgi:3-hydroxyacyl-[acyl-carrier-protein] dehydratase|nr:beta-hydroxyacyl-ACP dehydratase [Rubripirellula sp.]MDA9778527.1 beta-hydroxyacyl-ACP dehydratase [Rubripirellula sp.]
MKYCQLDRITSLDLGHQLTAERTLRAEEEYLKDHFPLFPVMPGVMMLEALQQASAWLLHLGDSFKFPLVFLREAKGVKFGDFLSPGETLEISAQIIKDDGHLATLKATASKKGRVTVSARLTMERSQSDDPEWLGTDERVRSLTKKLFFDRYGDPSGIPKSID